MTEERLDKSLAIAVIGTGGVGGYFGGRLALAGHRVTFLARGAHLAAIKENGLEVASIQGDFVVNDLTVTDDPATIPVQDVILFATKTWQLSEVAEQLKGAVGDNTLVIPLLNGVDAPTQLKGIFNAENVLGGLCKIISFIEAPGKIKHTGALPFIAYGELDGGVSTRAQRLSQVFEKAQIKHHLSSHILSEMWEKFLFISAMSALGTITDSPIGPIRTNHATRKALSDVMLEIQTVAQQISVDMKEDIVDRTMQFVDKLPPQSTTSMQRDIAAGKLSEIEAQLGTVVKLAKAYELETPVSDFIYETIKLQIKG